MDANNWRPTQGGEPGMEAGDWRSQLQPDSRHRIVNKIMETLKRHLPVSGQEGLSELRKIAVRFEEKIFTAATSQSDYLRKISLKMLTMETKTQPTMGNPLPSNPMVPSNKPLDAASQSMQPPSISVPQSSNQSQQRQQIIPQNIPNNIVPQSSSSLSSAVPPVAGLAPSSMSNMVGQNPNIQNVSGVPQNSGGNAMGQGVPSNVFTNSQRPLQGRQVVPQQQQQQPQTQQQQYLYQQQQQQMHQIMKHKFQQGNMSHPLMQPPHIPQQQQNVMQSNQMQSSQQSVMQPSMMQSSLSNLQQNQQSPIQQSTQSMLQQPPQPVLRQQPQSQQHAVIHQQPTMSQQTNLSSQQQQQLINQQTNSSNMQQSPLIGQQTSVGDMQQQLPQQSRSHGQQSNLSNMQSPPSQQHMAQQSNLSSLQQQQLGPQSNVSGLQQMHGTQSGNSNMQSNQHSMHLLQQNKVQMQQQPPQNTSNLLSTQGQQGQLQSSQQLMSQIPLQSTQVQQQVPLQQQQQQQATAMSHELQQRIPVGGQAPGSLLQSQNVMDQQKQLYHSQRALPETSSTSLDSTAQTGQANGGDWQEEIYQKIKAMRELYFNELKEMYQKILPKVHQYDSLPQQPKLEQLNKLKTFKGILERLLTFLQLSKNSIAIELKDKIGQYEKQIVSFLHSNRPSRNRAPTLQPGQHPTIQPIQQSQSQMTPLQSPENQINPQLHSANMQGSVAPVQQNNMSSMQHNSLPTFSGSAAQQNMTIPMQPGSSLESGQGNSLSSLQQVAAGSLQQNPSNSSQRSNNGSLPSQNVVNTLQQNINSLQSNPNMLQHPHLKQQDPQQLLQSQQLKQMQQRQLKQQVLQHQQHQQHQQQQQQQQQQQPQLHQQQSQLHQQGKQQLPTQMQTHPMSHLNQMEISDLKIRQGLAAKPGMFQHLPATQRAAYTHQQMKPGTSFPISPPIFQAASPQVAQNSSPQVDQQSLLSSITKTGTPLQSASSPFVVPSPSTPMAPSPMPGESEKPTSGVSAHTNAGNAGQQTGVSGTQAQSLAIGTPGISASPLLAECGTDGAYANVLPTVSGKSSFTEQPLERLIKAVKSMSPKALSASVNGIGSVVSMIDRIAGSAPGNGSRAAVGEDLVAMTKCRLQARNFSHDGPNGTKKMRRHTSAMPLNVVSSAGSVNDVFKPLTGAETSDLESTATSSAKRPRVEANHVLLEEIREINQRLIDTVVVISDEVVDPSALAAAADGSEGTVVKCSFSAVALSPSLKSQYTSAQMSPIQPLRLLVPTNYPNCSPILLDKFSVEVSKEYEDLSIKAKSRFSISLRNLSQPMLLRDIARTWDICARAVVSEYAQQSGGGSFCSKYGAWENCLSAA